MDIWVKCARAKEKLTITPFLCKKIVLQHQDLDQFHSYKPKFVLKIKQTFIMLFSKLQPMSYNTPTLVGVVRSAFTVLSSQSNRLIGKYELKESTTTLKMKQFFPVRKSIWTYRSPDLSILHIRKIWSWRHAMPINPVSSFPRQVLFPRTSSAAVCCWVHGS